MPNSDDPVQEAESEQPEREASDDSPVNAERDESDSNPVQAESVGCGPAILAGTLLMGIVFFIFCGITTWILFQKRTEFASRTIQGFIPMIEQSLLEPSDKDGVIEQLESLTNDMKAPDYDPALAGAIMERLVRLPIPHWGELDAIEAKIESDFEGDEKQQALIEISRIRRSVETGQATVHDLIDVLDPVATPDDSQPLGRSLQQPLRLESVREVIGRAKLLADRDQIPDQRFDKVTMSEILRREITKAKQQGGF